MDATATRGYLKWMAKNSVGNSGQNNFLARVKIRDWIAKLFAILRGLLPHNNFLYMAKDLFAKAPENKEFKIMPAGSHVARCYSIVDLGTQEKVFKQTGEIKDVHVIRITWEFPTELSIFDEEKGEQPFVLGEEYTLSLADKANLRNVLESWNGRPLTEDELHDGYNLRDLVGKECLIGVIHTKSKDGTKTYANIQTIGQIPKGLVCPLQINKSQYFVLDTEDFDQEVFELLPEFVQKKIMESKEYKAMDDYTAPEFA